MLTSTTTTPTDARPSRYVRPPPAAPARLSLQEAMLASEWARGRRDRAMVRDSLLVGLAALLPAGETNAQHARRLATNLREPDQDGWHSSVLQTVRRLSVSGAPMCQDRIEKVLNRAKK